MVDKQRFGITKSQCIPGFILPLEVLAFECIEPLRSKYREAVDPVEDGCPILCRGKFKKSACKGFSLSELYEQLGDSTDIRSTLVPVHEGEEDAHIAPQELDTGNPIVDGWNRIITGNGKIFWEDYRLIDVEARADIPHVAEEEQTEPPIIVGGAPAQVNVADVMKIIDQMDVMFQNLSTNVEGLSVQVCELSARVRAIEDHINRENKEVEEDSSDVSGEDAEGANDGTKDDDGANDGTDNDDDDDDGANDGTDDDGDDDGANDGTDDDNDDDGASDGTNDDDDDGAKDDDGTNDNEDDDDDGTNDDGAKDESALEAGTSRKRTRSWYYKEPFAKEPVGKGKGKRTGDAKRTKK